ncbi:MAG: hypothetical protein M5U12_32320 [Verrucomicrobia bacterium]|nr:hypothetical protein [Verrucomicrobiota bacterium]
MSLQAQLITRVNFSAAEGYVDGPLWGQPARTGTPTWTCVSENTGDTYVREDGIRHICQSITNGALCIRPDQNLGELTSVMYWAFPFPAQRKGPITVTWDWQFFPTNEIPTDYDPTNNNYQATLQGTDVGFTLSDSANRTLGDSAVWAVFNELSTPTRMGGLCDSRYNGNGEYGTCGGGGNWNDKGPQYKDGKKVHMKMVAYFGNPDDPANDSFDVWAQREGEDVWHTTVNDFYPDGKFPMRRCPGEADGDPKLDCITMWLNTGVYGTYILVDNIQVSGPDPIETYRIGLNFGADEANGSKTGTLAATDQAGVPGVAQANWNNLSLLSGSNATPILAEVRGTAEPTAVAVAWNSANTWSSTGRGEENNAFSGADKALMTGYLDTGNATTSTVQIVNLPAQLTEAGYDVYVYAMGGVGGRGGSYRILDTATGKVLRDSIRAQSPTNLASYVEVPTNLGATANGAATLVFGAGNYLVFRGLTAAAITVEARTAAAGGGVGYSGTPRAPINAIQLVSPAAEAVWEDVTMPGDWIVTSNSDDRSPAVERVPNAIDNNVLTKYLNFGNDTDQAPPFVGPVGLTVKPGAGASVVTGLAFTSANDAPERDPAAYKLEGSNDGTTFTLISEGPVGPFSARFIRQEIGFANTVTYTTYRLSIPSVANNATANSMQFAEVELLGTVVAPKFTAVTHNANGSVTVQWKGGGTLQAAPSLAGPWQDVPGATSPYTFNPAETGPVLFGRIKK